MTELLFMSVLLFCLGVIFGKFFKKLNPFLILLGLLFFIPIAEALSEQNNIYYNIVFASGVLGNFLKQKKFALNLVEDVKMSIQLSQARKRQQQQQNFYQSQVYRQEMEEEKQRMNKEWERIKKAWDDLIKEKEEFERQKRQYQQKGNSRQEQAKTETKGDFKTKQSRYFKEFERFDLDNFKSNDPCEVLGISKEATKQEILKAWKKLLMKYHPDKHANESLEMLQEAKQIAILLNWAREELS